MKRILKGHHIEAVIHFAASIEVAEMALEDYAKAYGIGHTILRYFNVAGAQPEGRIGTCARRFSVLEIIAACERVLGRKSPVRYEPRCAGDPAILIASSEKSAELATAVTDIDLVLKTSPTL